MLLPSALAGCGSGLQTGRMAKRTGFWLGACAAGLALAQPVAPALAGGQTQITGRSDQRTSELAKALAMPVASELTGAENAPRFAWVENAAGARNIWIADRGQPARRITAYVGDDGQQLYDLTFSRDGRALAFVRGGDGEFPDDPAPNAGIVAATPLQQILLIPADGVATIMVGEGHSPVFAPAGDRLVWTRRGAIWIREIDGTTRKLVELRGEVSRLQWSPDGTRLLFVEDRGNHGFAALLDIADARLRYLDPGLGNAAEPIFSPDGRQVAFIRYLDPPPGAAGDAPDGGPYWSIRVADAATGVSRLLWEAPRGPGSRFMGTRSRNLFWSADGQLVFPWERTGWIHAYAIDAAKGGEPRALMSGTFEVETFLLGADGRSLIYAANAGDIDRRHIWRRPLGAGAAVALTTGQGIESYPTVAGDALAVIATDMTHPAHPALLGDKGKLAPLGTVSVARGFIAPEPVSFRAADGVEVRGQLFRGRGAGKRPALIFIHGGPRRQMLLGFHPSGYYSNAYIMNQHMAAQGYDVLAVNYRSGTGYGQAFREAPGIARAGASEYRDILAAGRWLAARDDVDPKRIGLWGGSWGGYLTALGLARDSDLFAAGVDLHGVHSMLRALPTSLSPAVQDAARQLQWESSPMGAIDRWKSPVLLIHGDDDRNVDFSQSLLLARELAARRIPFRELVFPNERHSFIRYDHWLEALRATDAFLGETLMKKDSAR